MCQEGANRNMWAGYRISPSQREVLLTEGSSTDDDRFEHIMWGRWAAWSPLWWWPCSCFYPTPKTIDINCKLKFYIDKSTSKMANSYRKRWCDNCTTCCDSSHHTTTSICGCRTPTWVRFAGHPLANQATDSSRIDILVANADSVYILVHKNDNPTVFAISASCQAVAWYFCTSKLE